MVLVRSAMYTSMMIPGQQVSLCRNFISDSLANTRSTGCANMATLASPCYDCIKDSQSRRDTFGIAHSCVCTVKSGYPMSNWQSLLWQTSSGLASPLFLPAHCSWRSGVGRMNDREKFDCRKKYRKNDCVGKKSRLTDSTKR